MSLILQTLERLDKIELVKGATGAEWDTLKNKHNMKKINLFIV